MKLVDRILKQLDCDMDRHYLSMIKNADNDNGEISETYYLYYNKHNTGYRIYKRTAKGLRQSEYFRGKYNKVSVDVINFLLTPTF